MNLISENCTVTINDDQIDCKYDFILGESKQWKLNLREAQLQYKDGIRNRDFDSKKIKEFCFEIEQGIQKAHNLTQVGIAYVVEIDREDPVELFRICVKEEIKSASHTKSYEFSENILKKLARRYNKPYFFKHSISTRQKSRRIWLSISLAAVAAVTGILLAFGING